MSRPRAKDSGEAVVLAENLVRRFGAIKALDGLTLRMFPGELFGLVGPDGAGKTTALRILAGMIAPDEGEVSVLGENPLGGSTILRNALGYMPQQYSLYGDLSVEENLHFFARMFCLPKPIYRERRARLLQITRLEPYTERRADALSGGMYKKLALACALLPRPRLLLLDEPTNGVDPVSRRELWALLFELAAEGMAIVVSTPYMDEAARCHRVGLMHRGRFILEGTPASLLAGFTHPVYELRGGDREQWERLLADHPAVMASSAAGISLRLVVRPGTEPALQEILSSIGATLHPARPDFEDLYLAATAEE